MLLHNAQEVHGYRCQTLKSGPEVLQLLELLQLERVPVAGLHRERYLRSNEQTSSKLFYNAMSLLYVYSVLLYQV